MCLFWWASNIGNMKRRVGTSIVNTNISSAGKRCLSVTKFICRLLLWKGIWLGSPHMEALCRGGGCLVRDANKRWGLLGGQARICGVDAGFFSHVCAEHGGWRTGRNRGEELSTYSQPVSPARPKSMMNGGVYP